MWEQLLAPRHLGGGEVEDFKERFDDFYLEDVTVWFKEDKLFWTDRN